jgi:hypothetical protein
MIIISPSDMSYWEVRAYIESIGGGYALRHDDPLWLTFADGRYWTSSRVACNSQVAVVIEGGVKTALRWDRSFKAKAVVKQ